MKISRIQQNHVNPIFQAKISPSFEKFMRSFINNGSNRIQKNYMLNKKLADFERYGFNDYTVNLVTIHKSWGNEYSLVSTKEGQELKKGIFLLKKNSAKGIIETFLHFRKNEFVRLMKKNYKFLG